VAVAVRSSMDDAPRPCFGPEASQGQEEKEGDECALHGCSPAWFCLTVKWKAQSILQRRVTSSDSLVPI